MLSEAQKAAAIKWDRAHMTTVSCKLKKEKAILFRESCQKLGLIPNQVLKDAIDSVIRQAEGV